VLVWVCAVVVVFWVGLCVGLCVLVGVDCRLLIVVVCDVCVCGVFWDGLPFFCEGLWHEWSLSI